MITIEEYGAIVSELMDELPDEFFRELSGGVIVSESVAIPDYAQGNDLYTLGKYQIFSRVRQITMFKGSFDRVYPRADVVEARRIFGACCAMRSGIILSPWAGSTTLPPWRRRTSETSRRTFPNMGPWTVLRQRRDHKNVSLIFRSERRTGGKCV